MKKLHFIFAITFSVLLGNLFNATAQAPEGFTYQAEARDASGKLLINKVLTVKTTILQGSATDGFDVWDNNYTVTTDKYGLFSIVIGEAENETSFSEIEWGTGKYFLNVQIKYGTTWINTGTTQLLSVPYALYAKSAGNETDPIFSVWDKSLGIKITESQISDLGNYIEAESLVLLDVLTLNNSAGNKNITNLANPVNAQDAATKAYVDALKQQMKSLVDNLISAGIDVLQDVEGNIYKVVKIGNQVWMAENLKTTKYNDGENIPLVTDNTDWSTIELPGYCWYNHIPENKDIYGALYNWYAVNTGKLCPTGWHVATDADWTTLTTFLGGESVAGGKMKETGTAHWASPNTGATNESGFSALPGGNRSWNSSFVNMGKGGLWWSSMEDTTINAWYYYLTYNGTNAYRYNGSKRNGFSVRCVRD